jgi:hypothetical protein
MALLSYAVQFFCTLYLCSRRTLARFRKRGKEMRSSYFLMSAVAAALVGCAAPSTHVLTGTARPPISPADVKIYSTPPAVFEEVAVLDANAKSAFGTGGQKSVDLVIERLKIEAAKLGANGVILEGFQDAQTGSIGAGGGSDSYSRSSSVGVGVGGSLGIYKKTGHGDAIYVPPGSSVGTPLN